MDADDGWVEALDAVPVPLVLVSVDDGTARWANAAFRRLLGSDLPAGVRLADLFDGTDEETLDAALTMGLDVTWIAAKLRGAGGRSTPVELVPGIPRKLDGQAVSVVAVREVGGGGIVDDLVLKAHDILGEGVLIGDGQRLLYANDAACSLYGRSLEGLREVGSVFGLLVDDEQLRISELIDRRRAVGAAPPERYETTIVRPDGTTVDVEMSVKAAVRADHVRTVTIVRNIADRRATTRALTRLALEDPLTGLPNRRLLIERIGQAIARGIRTESTDVLFFLDLNQFKAINDEDGHAAGDTVLVEVAERLSRVVRPGDTVARLGGDEFIVLAEDVGAPLDVDGFADRLLQAIEEPMTVAGRTRRVSASIGVQTFGADSKVDPAELLRGADAAMYRAKPGSPWP